MRKLFLAGLAAVVMGCSGADKPFDIKAPKQVDGHKTEGQMKGTESSSSHYIAAYDLKVSLDKSSELYMTSTGVEYRTELCVPSSVADPGEIVWTRTEGLDTGQVTVRFHDCEPYVYRKVGKLPISVDLTTAVSDTKKWVETAYQGRKKEIRDEQAEAAADIISAVAEGILEAAGGSD